ncbi:MAG TPA: response regulator [Chitinophagaceae bacterium]|nr:response regulator [Chitinophagaceae bacterium]
MYKSYILIAEDDADDRFLLETAFEECGYKDKLIFVENGIELIDYLDNAKMGNGLDRKFPAFIMLDLNMPKKDGREVLKEIKESPDYKTIPVVIFTTTKNENEIRRCYELGANSYVVKPVNFEHLVKVIGQIRDYWFSISSAAE